MIKGDVNPQVQASILSCTPTRCLLDQEAPATVTVDDFVDALEKEDPFVFILTAGNFLPTDCGRPGCG